MGSQDASRARKKGGGGWRTRRVSSPDPSRLPDTARPRPVPACLSPQHLSGNAPYHIHAFKVHTTKATHADLPETGTRCPRCNPNYRVLGRGGHVRHSRSNRLLCSEKETVPPAKQPLPSSPTSGACAIPAWQSCTSLGLCGQPSFSSGRGSPGGSPGLRFCARHGAVLTPSGNHGETPRLESHPSALLLNRTENKTCKQEDIGVLPSA